ncbi:hypothetical protein Tco_0410385 [Tanacetum coccineum]
MMNFIYDQEERIKQLKNYMQNITNEFMEFSSEVALRLKERIKEAKAMSKRARSTGGHASSAHNERMEEKVRKFRLFDNEDHQMNYNTLVGRSIHSEDVGWKFLSKMGSCLSILRLHHSVTLSLANNGLTFFPKHEPIFREACSRSLHLFEFGCPPLDGGYNVGNTKAKSIRNLRIRLAHRCRIITITGRKETTMVSTKLIYSTLLHLGGWDLFAIFPIVLAKLPKSVRKRVVIFGGKYCKQELHEGECCWPATREVEGEGGGDDEEGDGEGRKQRDWWSRIHIIVIFDEKKLGSS